MQLGMLPSEFMARATSLDVGLLEDYYADLHQRREQARKEAELGAGAEAAAEQARKEL